jgi:hypothetical protein
LGLWFFWLLANNVWVDCFTGTLDIEDIFVYAVFYHVALDRGLGDLKKPFLFEGGGVTDGNNITNCCIVLAVGNS